MFTFLASAVSEVVAAVDQQVESNQASAAERHTDLGLPPGEPQRLQTALAWAVAAYVDPTEEDEDMSPLPHLHAEAALRVRALPKHSVVVDKSGASNTR